LQEPRRDQRDGGPHSFRRRRRRRLSRARHRLSAAGGATLTTGSGTISRTGISVTGDLINSLSANPASFYFNVHTSLNGTLRNETID